MFQYLMVALTAGSGAYLFMQEYTQLLGGVFVPLLDALKNIPV